MSKQNAGEQPIRSEECSGMKPVWHAPVIQDVEISNGTGFACSPCPDSGCATARSS